MTHEPSISVIPGEKWRFYVKSINSIGVTYIVDLSEHDCNGGCTCPQFTFRILPFIETNPARCKHIRRVRDFILDNIIAQTSEPKQKQKWGDKTLLAYTR